MFSIVLSREAGYLFTVRETSIFDELDYSHNDLHWNAAHGAAYEKLFGQNCIVSYRKRLFAGLSIEREARTSEVRKITNGSEIGSRGFRAEIRSMCPSALVFATGKLS